MKGNGGKRICKVDNGKNKRKIRANIREGNMFEVISRLARVGVNSVVWIRIRSDPKLFAFRIRVLR